MNPQGYLPPDQRNPFQVRLGVNYDERTPRFADVNRGAADRPDAALLFELETKATGKLLPRIGQKEGSCVGVSWARSLAQAICGDIVVRRTREEVKNLFAFATWGYSRRLAGLNSRGGGSFGAAMARAGVEFGMLATDNSLLPPPTEKDGWLWWTSKIELDFSVPKHWPVPEAQLALAANERQVTYTVRIRTTAELEDALVQGYGVTMASMFGTRARVVQGLLLGAWNDSWAHQMSIGGYMTHPAHGRVYLIDNQWGPTFHGDCPYLAPKGVRGSFWIRESTMKDILKSSSTEVFAHGQTEDWPVRSIDWELGFGT